MVEEYLALVEMSPYASRYPHELSGGQQQRVALARTLVYEPVVLLLDEPLSNVDAKLRERARGWFRQMQRKFRLTTLFVTHDQSEALAMSDLIAVMSQGRIVQFGTPAEVYGNPTSVFVADFVGSSNVLSGRVRSCRRRRRRDRRLESTSSPRASPAGTPPARRSASQYGRSGSSSWPRPRPAEPISPARISYATSWAPIASTTPISPDSRCGSAGRARTLQRRDARASTGRLLRLRARPELHPALRATPREQPRGRATCR